MGFASTVFVFSCITLISVVGVFMLTGLTGLFSFGQAAFMAVGAYVSGICVIKLGLPFVPSIIIGVLISVAIAFIIGMPTMNLRKDYFSLITFGFGEAIAALLNYFVNITGGAMGLNNIPKKTTLALVVVSTIVIIIIARNYKYSKFGRMSLIVKNDETAAKSFGINVLSVKMCAFMLSSAIIAYAGALYGFFTTYVEPAMFGWSKSSEWVIMVFLGGVNSLTGSVISTIFLTVLPEALRFASEYRIVLYCVLIIIALNFRPNGLFGEYEISFKKITAFFSKGDAKNKVKAGKKERSV